jgi:hypothetical protein
VSFGFDPLSLSSIARRVLLLTIDVFDFFGSRKLAGIGALDIFSPLVYVHGFLRLIETKLVRFRRCSANFADSSEEFEEDELFSSFFGHIFFYTPTSLFKRPSLAVLGPGGVFLDKVTVRIERHILSHMTLFFSLRVVAARTQQLHIILADCYLVIVDVIQCEWNNVMNFPSSVPTRFTNAIALRPDVLLEPAPLR